jgi:bacterioferritin-associated ferredoxin
MYVCVCNGVTDKQIRRAIAGGAQSVQSLRDELGVASQCGGCLEHTLQLLEGSDASRAGLESDLFYSPA